MPMMTSKTMLGDPALAAYLQAHQPVEHVQLRELRLRTLQHPEAAMQITIEQGHLLALLIKLMTARTVLEVGTFTGYSTLAMALALPTDGRLIACDIDPAAPEIGNTFWSRAGVAQKIDLRIGPALETLSTLQQNGWRDCFDLAFIDADKTGYDSYYEASLALIRPGGLIIFDNMLQRGRVADPVIERPDTVAVRSLNAKLATDSRVECVLLPIARVFPTLFESLGIPKSSEY